MVTLGPVTSEAEAQFLLELVQRHFQYTGSEVAREILSAWEVHLREFVRVMPSDYERALREADKGKEAA